MAYWYLGGMDELLIDLDDYMRPSKSGCPWGEAFFRRRLRDAIRDKKLDVKLVYLHRSSTKGHYHAFVKLWEPIGRVEALVWQLHLGSDLYRGRADLMRWARKIPAPSLLIEKEPIPNFYKSWSYKCDCEEKHITEKIMALPPDKRCPVWQMVRGYSPWELFGRSTKQVEKSVSLPVGIVPLELIMREDIEQ